MYETSTRMRTSLNFLLTPFLFMEASFNSAEQTGIKSLLPDKQHGPQWVGLRVCAPSNKTRNRRVARSNQDKGRRLDAENRSPDGIESNAESVCRPCGNQKCSPFRTVGRWLMVALVAPRYGIKSKNDKTIKSIVLPEFRSVGVCI